MIRHSNPGWSDDGASHRMIGDTPPLKGYCQGTYVPRCERYKTSDFNKIRVPYQELVKRNFMAGQDEKRENNSRRLKGRMARSQSIGTKLTPDEERQILAAAEAEGKAPSERVRDLLLRGAIASNRGAMEMHLFTELVGIQMLLMNALEPLLREKMAQEQLTALYRRIQTTKAAQAQELLAKRNLNKEMIGVPRSRI
jgi:hypothetical protein